MSGKRFISIVVVCFISLQFSFSQSVKNFSKDKKFFLDELNTFFKEFPNSYILDFSNSLIDDKKGDIKTLVIGPEGGFSEKERESFDKNFVVGIKSNIILRSETAIITASSKIIV